MKVLGLDGKEYKLTLKTLTRPSSKGHTECRKLLKQIFPYDPAYEEVVVSGCGPTLYLDFIIPNRKLVIEVQGEQHRTQSKFFGGETAFKKQVKRDTIKQQWCELNNLILVKLDDDRTTEWESTIRNCFLKTLDRDD